MLRISFRGAEYGGDVEGGSWFFDLFVLVGLAVL